MHGSKNQGNTNTNLSADQVALKYKELWQVEQVFREVKSVLETRPVYHQRDETIRGHVFFSFLALVLRKELDRRLAQGGHCFEWADIKQDLKSLQEVVIRDNGKSLAVRTECIGTVAKCFRLLELLIRLPLDRYERYQRAIGSAKNFFCMAIYLKLQNLFFSTVKDQSRIKITEGYR